MKKIMIVCFTLLTAIAVQAQDKFFTKNGKISFDATAPKSPENIMAVNKSVTCVMDVKTGVIQFAVLMKGFEFERALMQEHFNENYMESNQYPKAEFKGSFTNLSAVNFQKDGVYAVAVKGKLSMHGKTNDVTADGKLTVKGSSLQLNALFTEPLSAYAVTIPQLVADKVSSSVKITVDCLLQPLK